MMNNTTDMYNNNMPMKWHKFLVYFEMWASGILSLLLGGFYMFGLRYIGAVTSPYDLYGGLKALDVAYGIATIAYGIYTLYARSNLAHFRKDAPRKLTVLYVFGAIIVLVYRVIFVSIYNSNRSFFAPEMSVFNRSLISSMVGAVVGIAINRVYYAKRSHMFSAW